MLGPDDEIAIYGYCNLCVHLNIKKIMLGKRSCAAFDDIPLSIWNGDNKHETAYAASKSATAEHTKICPFVKFST